LMFNSIFIAAACGNKRNMKNINNNENIIQRNREMHALCRQTIQYNTNHDNIGIQSLSRLQNTNLRKSCACLLIDDTCFAAIWISKV
jgi:hypothetical protein